MPFTLAVSAPIRPSCRPVGTTLRYRMHLMTILAFACLFWRAEEPIGWRVVPNDDWLYTLLIVLSQPILLGIASWRLGRRARRLLARQPDAPQLAQLAYHRATLVLRFAALAGFVLGVFLTPWPDWFAFGRITPALQIVGDTIVLSPFFAGAVAIWLGAYPVDRAMRGHSSAWITGSDSSGEGSWNLRTFLVFNLRHQLLIVAVPMTLILFAADLTRGYEDWLQALTGSVWTPDMLVGAVAVGVFVLAPWMLCRIWHTVPLESGPVRDRLETIAARIGLTFRDILVWHSDGMMINAAVMGVIPPVRYVLLSDGLLATMSVEQIEAVFGHEAGHVRHRHIQHFLVFAVVGWLLVAGLMELLARFAIEYRTSEAVTGLTIQTIGIAGTIAYWGLGFGWLSRRFEREADLFGARCVTPPSGGCVLPCGVHGAETDAERSDDRVCATGAAIFGSALDRVALLNGIPHEERSWRHSSIGSRIRFLASLAGDPNRARRFQQLVRRVRMVMIVFALIGCVVTVLYWRDVSQPVLLSMPVGVR